MALFYGNLHSEALRMETQICLLLPQDTCQDEGPARVLYLLHGLGDNASCWQRYSQVESLFRHRNVLVVMPEVQRSFYCDMAMGGAYFTYITQELPALVARGFRVSSRREDTFVAGLSMGGFGALKCALSCPEQYGGAASFSGAVSMSYVVESAKEHHRLERQVQAVLGEEIPIGAENDLLALAKSAGALPADQRPRLLSTCGLSDRLLEINRAFAAEMEDLPLVFSYREWEGDHTWQFWNESLPVLVEYLLENDA